jgi:hypothetical protein
LTAGGERGRGREGRRAGGRRARREKRLHLGPCKTVTRGIRHALPGATPPSSHTDPPATHRHIPTHDVGARARVRVNDIAHDFR